MLIEAFFVNIICSISIEQLKIDEFTIYCYL